jgi:hypothetical protein
MPWHARLHLAYQNESARTVARFRHDGPLRILQSLYPEGDTVCHNVLVHPPGGLVGGDTLDIDIEAADGSHGLITTPGASRFYRSEGELALQRTRIRLAAGARLEWLPLEAICYSGCQAENRLSMEVAPGAELIGWDVTALGLPNANQPFERGTLPAAHRGARHVAGARAHRRGRPAPAAKPHRPGRPPLHGLAVLRGRFAGGARAARRVAGPRARRCSRRARCSAAPAPPARMRRWWCCACWPRWSSPRCSCCGRCGWRGAMSCGN